MGECLIVRRGGESYELPVLSASYPKDVTVTAAAGASASFSISITTPGRPAEYTYQWYRNGAAVSGGTAASLTLTGLTAAATYSVYSLPTTYFLDAEGNLVAWARGALDGETLQKGIGMILP